LKRAGAEPGAQLDSYHITKKADWPAAAGQDFRPRKIVLTVWDNAEFGCELAYMAARLTRSEVLLADLDLLSPKADLFLNVRKFPARPLPGGLFGCSGLDMVMDAIGKGRLTSGILQHSAISRKDIKNLHVITGSYRLENFEYYNEDSIPVLIEKCYRCYDITILLVNRSVYDAFTLAALLRSDLNLAAVRGSVDQFREFNTYITFLRDKQQLPLEHTKFVLFEHDSSSSMSFCEAKEASEGNLLGKISCSTRRMRCRNRSSAYVSHMEKNIIGEYRNVLVMLGLLPPQGIWRKLTSHRSRFLGKTPAVSET